MPNLNRPNLQLPIEDPHLRGGVGYGSDGAPVAQNGTFHCSGGYGCEAEVSRRIPCDKEEEVGGEVFVGPPHAATATSSSGSSSAAAASPPRNSSSDKASTGNHHQQPQHRGGGSPPGSPGSRSGVGHRTTDTAAAGQQSDHNADRNKSDSNSNSSSSSNGSQSECVSTVRVVFTQRRVRRSDGGGVETFRTESFGTPIMAVLPPVRRDSRHSLKATSYSHFMTNPITNDSSSHTR